MINLCYCISGPTPLTRALSEWQGPSTGIPGGGGAQGLEKYGWVRLDPQSPSIRTSSICGVLRHVRIFRPLSIINPYLFCSVMARSTENFETPFNSWLDFDTPLVWGPFHSALVFFCCFFCIPLPFMEL